MDKLAVAEDLLIVKPAYLEGRFNETGQILRAAFCWAR